MYFNSAKPNILPSLSGYYYILFLGSIGIHKMFIFSFRPNVTNCHLNLMFGVISMLRSRQPAIGGKLDRTAVTNHNASGRNVFCPRYFYFVDSTTNPDETGGSTSGLASQTRFISHLFINYLYMFICLLICLCYFNIRKCLVYLLCLCTLYFTAGSGKRPIDSLYVCKECKELTLKPL